MDNTLRAILSELYVVSVQLDQARERIAQLEVDIAQRDQLRTEAKASGTDTKVR